MLTYRKTFLISPMLLCSQLFFPPFIEPYNSTGGCVGGLKNFKAWREEKSIFMIHHASLQPIWSDSDMARFTIISSKHFYCLARQKLIARRRILECSNGYITIALSVLNQRSLNRLPSQKYAKASPTDDSECRSLSEGVKNKQEK